MKYVAKCSVFFSVLVLAGSEAVEIRAAALQGRGWHVERPATPKHCAFLRLMGVAFQRPQVHRAGDGAHDVRNPKNVCRMCLFHFHIILSVHHMFA